MKTTAVEDGNSIIFNGQKIFIDKLIMKS